MSQRIHSLIHSTAQRAGEWAEHLETGKNRWLDWVIEIVPCTHRPLTFLKTTPIQSTARRVSFMVLACLALFVAIPCCYLYLGAKAVSQRLFSSSAVHRPLPNGGAPQEEGKAQELHEEKQERRESTSSELSDANLNNLTEKAGSEEEATATENEMPAPAPQEGKEEE